MKDPVSLVRRVPCVDSESESEGRHLSPGVIAIGGGSCELPRGVSKVESDDRDLPGATFGKRSDVRAFLPPVSDGGKAARINGG